MSIIFSFLPLYFHMYFFNPKVFQKTKTASSGYFKTLKDPMVLSWFFFQVLWLLDCFPKSVSGGRYHENTIFRSVLGAGVSENGELVLISLHNRSDNSQRTAQHWFLHLCRSAPRVRKYQCRSFFSDLVRILSFSSRGLRPGLGLQIRVWSSTFSSCVLSVAFTLRPLPFF